LTLSANDEGARIYSLRLESRELRNQAQSLKRQRTDSMARELGYRGAAQDFLAFGGSPATG
ncbi:MAG: hypothetical protein QOJ42_1536, partial [Acidobacteriaceae bacterium]|nr:hypothetical protein [Acidobacteriaceae bacterium]